MSVYDIIDQEEDTFSSLEDYSVAIDGKKLSPKNAFELYIHTDLSDIQQKYLQLFIHNHNLDINSLYDFPTDSNEPTTLLNCLCEYRKHNAIELVLNMGANPNIQDTIQYTPFQSLIYGHSCADIGTESIDIINTINILDKHNTNFILENWQYDELYRPYLKTDAFFKQFVPRITIVENIND